MGKLNLKKLLLFTVVSAFGPALGSWANSVEAGQDVAFNLQNIVVPALPAVLATIAALFSNPRHR